MSGRADQGPRAQPAGLGQHDTATRPFWGLSDNDRALKTRREAKHYSDMRHGHS